MQRHHCTRCYPASVTHRKKEMSVVSPGRICAWLPPVVFRPGHTVGTNGPSGMSQRHGYARNMNHPGLAPGRKSILSGAVRQGIPICTREVLLMAVESNDKPNNIYIAAGAFTRNGILMVFWVRRRKPRAHSWSTGVGADWGSLSAGFHTRDPLL